MTRFLGRCLAWRYFGTKTTRTTSETVLDLTPLSGSARNSSAPGLVVRERVAAFVNNLPPAYVRTITAHSMGNIVVGSALREGMQVENYALLNAAVPAMCYDPNEALYEFARVTPDGDVDPSTSALGLKGKISDENVRRSMINFYLANDSAVTGIVNPPLAGEFGGWEHHNANYKPESFNLGTTGYEYDPDRDPGTKVYITFVFDLGRHLRSFHEAAPYATASRTKTVGADGRTAGAIKMLPRGPKALVRQMMVPNGGDQLRISGLRIRSIWMLNMDLVRPIARRLLFVAGHPARFRSRMTSMIGGARFRSWEGNRGPSANLTRLRPQRKVSRRCSGWKCRKI